MPTKKKRVGFIPREEVMKIIDKLSKENNLSNSKIISILVEEALSIRGIFDKKHGKVNHLYQSIEDDIQNSSKNSKDSKDNTNFSINTKLVNYENPGKSTLLKHKNQEDLDLHTYKKFISFLKFQEMMDKYNI